jgi:hypothetical protein
VVSDFWSLRGDIVSEALSARQSPAAKIPFLAAGWRNSDYREVQVLPEITHQIFEWPGCRRHKDKEDVGLGILGLLHERSEVGIVGKIAACWSESPTLKRSAYRGGKNDRWSVTKSHTARLGAWYRPSAACAWPVVGLHGDPHPAESVHHNAKAAKAIRLTIQLHFSPAPTR